ncbi:alanine racemase [Maritimibacter sp. DP07]|uniref:alanine racemase n=1 Tax=Maritimibacter harenae TaxID=2606218 RepID=A0A845LVY3_9RHOB|nr:alanine racemase C-terminal domain-containing protein [Maritimibacter harenae]MZR11516.1 alanine racemase [Maritimibacter harenae]
MRVEAVGLPASWCRIHLDRVSHNLERALALVPDGRSFCAVLKADAYGHGIDRIVPIVREQGVGTVGITSNQEAFAVRAAGFDGRLIRLRAAVPEEIEGALEARVEEQVGSRQAALHLRALANAGRLRTPLHLALNAGGMARDALDISTEPGRVLCREILDAVGGHVGGICSHFASNTPDALPRASALFQGEVAWVLANSDLRREALLVHVGSSLTLVAETPVETDMYRCAAVLYGILRPEWGFVPTMDVEARVVSLQDYPAGTPVGYDHATRLSRASRLACVSIGYQNGFDRGAGGRSDVVVRDRFAPVVGKVSMNAIVVDVTDVPRVAVGDTVAIFGGGQAQAIAPAQAERQFATIMADLYSDWGLRNPRHYG